MRILWWWCYLATYSTFTLCLVLILTQLGWIFNRAPLWFSMLFDEELQNTSRRVYTDHVNRKTLARSVVHAEVLLVNTSNREKVRRKLTRDSGVFYPVRTDLETDNTSEEHSKNSLLLSHSLASTSSSKGHKVNVQTATEVVADLFWQGNDGSTYADYGEKGCTWHSAKPIFKVLIKNWILIAKRLKITYFLTYGTLLGSYRNSALVPNDGDLDVIVDIRDYPKLKRLGQKRNFIGTEKKFHFVVQEDFEKPMDARRRFSCGGKQVPSQMDHCSFQEPLGRLIRENYHLDVYHYMVKGNIVEDPSEGGRVLQKSDIFPLKRCMLMGVETRCPKNPKALLTMLYGNDLKPLKICKNGRWVDAEKR